MSIIFDQYEERLERLKRNPSTVKGFRLAARDLEQYLRELGVPADQIEPHHLEEYFAQLDRAPTTKKLHLAHIGAAYRYAQRRGLLQRDPTVDVLLEKVPTKKPRTISNPELREMKARLITDREWMAFHLLAYTGMRRHEILKLKWDEVDIGDSTIYVIGKGDKERHVPIHPVLGEVLVERGRRGPNCYVLAGRARGGNAKPTAERTFWDLVQQMTGGKYSPHDFRRTVASSLFENDVNGDLIDEILGWSARDIRRRHYQRIAPAKLQRAILALYRDDPI